MAKRFFGLVLLFLLILASCSNLQYKRTLKQWTREQNIYSIDTFAAKVLWHATYLSSDYRATARAKINEWKKLPPGEMSSYPDYLMNIEAGYFIVSIYTPKAYPTLTTNTSDFWEFTLNLPTGESLIPASIESIKVTPREQRLFPYADRWSKFYLVKFSVSHLEMPFTLSLRSAGVTSFLEWY